MFKNLFGSFSTCKSIMGNGLRRDVNEGYEDRGPRGAEGRALRRVIEICVFLVGWEEERAVVRIVRGGC